MAMMTTEADIYFQRHFRPDKTMKEIFFSIDHDELKYMVYLFRKTIRKLTGLMVRKRFWGLSYDINRTQLLLDRANQVLRGEWLERGIKE